jgi:Pectate lyase superfamily protein
MASINYISGTVIPSTWLNDVNGRVYTDAINVKNSPYSAVGDGSTDDTSAITAAMTAASALGAPVYFPAGTYLTSPIAVPTGVSGIFGAGPAVSILYPTRIAHGAATNMLSLSGNTKRCLVRDIGLDMQDVLFDATYGIRLDAVGVALQNVNITGRATFGVINQSGTGCNIDRMLITGVGGNGILTGVYSQSTSSDFKVRNVNISGGHNYGVNLGGGGGNLIEDCTASAGNTTSGVFNFNLSLCTRSAIRNCFSVDSYREAANLTDCTYCTISGVSGVWTGVVGVDFGISINGTVAGGGSFGNVIIGNTVDNSSSSAYAVAGHSQNNIVTDNAAKNCGYRAGGTSSLLLVYTTSVGDTNSGNRFSNNVCTTVAGTTTNGCYESLAGGTTIANNIFDRNTLVGCTTRYSVVSTAIIIDHEWVTWAPTITASGGGGFTATANRARYNLNGKQCNIDLVITVTNAGGGGYVNFTLPFTAAAFGGPICGKETAVSGLMISGFVNGTNCELATYVVGNTAVLNYVLRVSGAYEIA